MVTKVKNCDEMKKKAILATAKRRAVVVKQVKKGTVTPVVPPSVARDYYTPEIKKIATQIKADDPKFVPEYKGSAAILKAKDGATLPHRCTAAIDCGFSMTLPAGWKVVLNALPQWAAKGLVVTNPGVVAEGRMKVYVTNVGKEIILIRPGEEVAQLSVEPLYLFDWISQ